MLLMLDEISEEIEKLALKARMITYEVKYEKNTDLFETL